mmetsp:Transcript_62789/g.141230  ORF Transcript_62789/g.141230 Transcript_62789/m.141230 type:complete len:89 (+) Transcript_62789:448-714(+)
MGCIMLWNRSAWSPGLEDWGHCLTASGPDQRMILVPPHELLTKPSGTPDTLGSVFAMAEAVNQPRAEKPRMAAAEARTHLSELQWQTL